MLYNEAYRLHIAENQGESRLVLNGYIYDKYFGSLEFMKANNTPSRLTVPHCIAVLQYCDLEINQVLMDAMKN